MAFILAILGACATGEAQQSPQVLRKHVPRAVSSGEAPLVGFVAGEQSIHAAVVLPLRNEGDLTALLSRLYDPSSPDYRKFLSVKEFTDRFGPTAEDYQAVVSFLEGKGLAVTDAPANRLIVPIAGTVTQVNAAFGVRMQLYRHPTENRTFHSPDREPSLDLGVRVAHISGLNDFALPRPAVRLGVEGQVLANVSGSGPGGSYLGSDMRAAYYGGTALTGAGQAVGLLEFGGYNLSDVNATFSNAGQTYTVPIKNVLLDGMTAAAGSDDAEEVLDIVQAIGMAPGMSQTRVYIGSQDASILNSMASENVAKQLSCSWSWTPDDPATDDPFFKEFAAQGQSFFAASGDDGAFNLATSPYFYPQEDSNVIAVGATHLTTTGPGGGWVSESSWNSAGHGSGGGISPDGFGIPSWQSGFANGSNGASTTLRNVPDVAMEGDFDNYYCANGACSGGAAGTSFAAPRWAGFMALVNQQAVAAGTAPAGGVGFINPALYAIAAGSSYSSDLHDAVGGNNNTASQPVYFTAVTGYDLVTGLGSANGQNLINALAGPPVPGFSLASSSGNVSVNGGGSGTTTITVTDGGGFNGSVTLAASGLPSGVTASFAANPTSANSTLTLTASGSAPSATATVTITGTSGTQTQTVKLTVVVHGSSFKLSDSPTTLSVAQGGTGTTTVTVTPQNGFTGNVNLAASGLPSGVTASFSPNPATGSSVLTLTASSSAAIATSTVTITGTSGTLTATTPLSLTVRGASFTVSASSVNIGQGSSGTSSVAVTPLNGFTGSVTLAASGLPSGVTASFSPNPTTGSSVLTLTATGTAPAGQYTVTVTGTSGGSTASTTLTLGVYAPSFTLSNSSSVSISQGGSGTSTVTINPQYGFSGSVTLSASGLPGGVTASFNPSSTTSSSVLTLTASPTATPGTVIASIVGTSGTSTASIPITIVVKGGPATVKVTASPSTITTAQSVTVTVAVSGGSGNPVATGSVKVVSGTYSSTATALTNGSATIVIPAGSLATGSDTLTATYTPDGASAYTGASGTTSVTVTTGTPAATASITVTGADTTRETATLTVAFNGFTETLRYDPSSTIKSVASALADMFSRDYLRSGLCAAASGGVINFKLKTGTFQPVSITGSNTSFHLAHSGF